MRRAATRSGSGCGSVRPPQARARSASARPGAPATGRSPDRRRPSRPGRPATRPGSRRRSRPPRASTAHRPPAVSDQPKRVRVSRAPARRARRRVAPAPSARAALGEPRPHVAEALLAPAIGEADDQQAGALRERSDPAAPGAREQRLGDDARSPLDDQRRVGEQAAGVAAVGRAPRMQRRSAAAARPVARATQAPSSSAAQSCRAAPKGTTTGPCPDRPARRDEHRDVTRGLLQDRQGVGLERRAAGGHQQQVGVLSSGEPREIAAWRRRREGRGPGRDAARAQVLGPVGERRGRGADLSRCHDAGEDQLTRRLRGRQRRRERERARRGRQASGGTTSSERSGAGADLARRGRLGGAGSSAGSCSRIARSSRLSSGARLEPELLQRTRGEPPDRRAEPPPGGPSDRARASAGTRSRSLSGCSATSASSSPTSIRVATVARSASICCSRAARRSSSRRAMSAWATRLVGQVGERRPAPECERFAQLVRGSPGFSPLASASSRSKRARSSSDGSTCST